MVSSFVAPPPLHTGTDRCPGALDPHRARDGGLVRVRIPGGSLPSVALARLADWSEELGNGRLELTGRGNLQLRGLAPGTETELAARLSGLGLLPAPTHDRARNILASPLSGRDGLGARDIRPLVAELDRGLCASPALADLPGRFLFALDDGRGDVAGPGADLTLVALPGERSAVLLGGQDSGLRPAAREGVATLLGLARRFLRVRADERVWRVAELPGGPLALRPGRAADRPVVGPVDGPVVGTSAPGQRRVDLPGRHQGALVGPVAQVDGRVALGVGVPLGRLRPDQCRSLADLAAREVLITPWRGVLLPDLDPGAVPAAARRLAGDGLLLDPGAPLLAVTACTGRPGCASALADVGADASAVVATAAPVHWSGCARRCGRPPGAVLDVVADQDGYRVLSSGVALAGGLSSPAARAVVAAGRAPDRAGR